MHKTILFLLAFLITPITASYAVDSTTSCNERPCEVTAKETEDKEYDFVCKWSSIPEYVTLTNGVKSDDGYCQKIWYCKKDGHYIKVHTKTIDNGTAFSHVSCEPCPYACRDDDTSCIQKANVVTRRNSTQNYSYARSVNACFLKILHTKDPGETPTGSDEIGSFRTKKSDNVYTCPY